MFRTSISLAVVAATLAFNLACAGKQYSVITAPQQVEIDHYVLIQHTRAGGMKVWDCRESPDGTRWDPTCVRTVMKNSEREER